MTNPSDVPGEGHTKGLTKEQLETSYELTAVNWEGRLHCCYLNDFRVAGGKPWAGGSTAKTWKVTLRDVIRAFPELQAALGLDYLGHPIVPASVVGGVQP